MFTGIVREIGRVRDLRVQDVGVRLTVECERLRGALEHGDSVAVNGVCVTCEEADAVSFTASLLQETLRKTNLGQLRVGSSVNIEPPLRAGDPIGGHFLQGHVDCTVRVLSLSRSESGKDAALVCELPRELTPFVFPGASIGLNGVSLTVRGVKDASMSVSLIPTTLEETNLGRLQSGDRVNLEVDLIIKSVYHSLQARVGEAQLSADALRKLGYD